jgi:hypothetical protein
MIIRHNNNGLYKRCPRQRRQWLKCAHSWHFDFFKGRKFRFSLDKIASARSEPLPRAKSASAVKELSDVIKMEARALTHERASQKSR